MSVLTRPALLRGLSVGVAVVAGGVWSASTALALGEVAASPEAVVPGGTVVVEGICPDPVTADSYVRATVGIDAIGRYVVVPVEDGAFRAKFRARGVGGYEDPVPGDKLRAQVSCATDASFVTNVGTVKVAIVDDVLDAEPSAKAVAATVPRAGATSAATSGGTDAPIPPWIPVTAFAIAAFGTAGAYALSRRNERQHAAAAASPDQRGVEPRRDAK